MHRLTGRVSPVLCLAAALWLLGARPASAQLTFDGMPRVNQWTDFENQSDELPLNPWGTCDTTNEDRIGIRVDFQDGTSGEATYSGVSGLWNTSFPDIAADTSAGFFTGCGGIHFLFNDGTSLPLAWNGCSMIYSGNFDLDYAESNGSHFRASTTGWVEATFQTYCGAAVPTMQEWTALMLAGLLALMAATLLRRTTRRTA